MKTKIFVSNVFLLLVSCKSSPVYCDTNLAKLSVSNESKNPNDVRIGKLFIEPIDDNYSEYNYMNLFRVPAGQWGEAEEVAVNVVIEDGVVWVEPVGGFSEGFWGTTTFGDVVTFEVTAERFGDTPPPIPTLAAQVDDNALTVDLDVAAGAWWILELTSPEGVAQVRTGRDASVLLSWMPTDGYGECGRWVSRGSTLRARAVSVTGAMSDWSEAVVP